MDVQPYAASTRPHEENDTHRQKRSELCMRAACKFGRVNVVRMLLKMRVVVTADHLWDACGGGHVEVVKVLLALPPSRAMWEEHLGAAYRIACKNGYVEIIKL